MSFRAIHAPARARNSGNRFPRRLALTAHIGSGHLPAVAVFRSETPEPGGPEVLCELLLREPVSLLRGDVVIVRLDGEELTLGSGRVLHPAPPARCPLPELAALRSEDPAALLPALLALEPTQALPLPRAAALLNQPTGDVAARVAAHSELTTLVAHGETHVAHTPSATALRRELLELLERLHAENRSQTGWPRDELRAKLRRQHSLLFDWVVDSAVAARELAAEGSLLRRAQHTVRHDPATERAIDALEKLYAKHGLAPPAFAELQSLVGAPAPVVRKAFDELVKRDSLVRVSREFHVESAAYARFLAAVRTRTPASGLTVQHVRDWFGLTRRHVIPLLEHLDAKGITRRAGDVRHLRRA
jgi:selenocysteine-specific elongation factor